MSITPPEPFAKVLRSSSGEEQLYAALANPDTLGAFVLALDAVESTPACTLIAPESAFRTATKPYYVGGKLADLLETDPVSVVAADPPLTTPAVVQQSQAEILPTVNSTPTASITVPGSEFCDTATTELKALADTNSEPTLHAPRYSETLHEFEHVFSSNLVSDIDAAFKFAYPEDKIAQTAEALLTVGAYHELKLYDLRQWANYSGVMSAATLSRVKQALEDANLIVTEGDSSGPGRPKERLYLAAPPRTNDGVFPSQPQSLQEALETVQEHAPADYSRD